MAFKQVTDRLYQLSIGAVNCFLWNGPELVLVDTGYPGSAHKIVEGINRLGKTIGDLDHIIVTHCHPDHAGSLAHLKKISDAKTYLHPLDAKLVRQGISGRDYGEPSPGLVNRGIYHFFIRGFDRTIQSSPVDVEVTDGGRVADGLLLIYTPGHTEGHLSVLIPDEGVLVAGDLCANLVGLSWSPFYENRTHAIQSLAKVWAHEFETCCFGHGRIISKKANRRLEKRFKRYTKK